jgi:hypothetical protein
MRRPLVLAALAVATLAPFGVAHAGTETPAGRFSSPTRAVAGAPIWIRSITPCPVVAGAYQFVRVGISPQSRPDDLTYIESTDGDLDPDGSWEVTISAPSDMALGITKSFDVQAQCIRNLAPYAAPDRDPSITTTTLDPEVSIFRYFQRPLSVTGFAASSATADGASDDTATSTTSSSSTTSTTFEIPLATTSTSSMSAQAVTKSSRPDDEQQRAAEARAELAARGEDGDRSVALGGEPVSATAPARSHDAGMPWWSFVAATMLAVGAVVAYGARRTAVSALVGRQPHRDPGGDAGVLLGEREVGGD